MINWITILTQVLPVVQAGITAIMNTEGKTPEQATAAFINHNTVGQPNSPTLSAETH